MLKIKDLHINLGEFALQQISLNITKGEYFVLLGESGSGKSVLLESIAGLVPLKQGTVELNGRDITNIKIQKRKVGLVFQDFALFPHLTVFQNIAYPLSVRKVAQSTIESKVNELGELLNIDCLFSRKPENLSGGEKQRVALARTLTLDPDILLLDEPLSAIDVSLKGELRSLLRKLNAKGQTIMHVTHDYEEAISLANRIGILHNGEIIQQGTPHEVFKHPKNKFVAHFSGVKNFFEATIHKSGNELDKVAQISSNISLHLNTKHRAKSGFVLIGQRNILLSKIEPTQTVNRFPGKIIEIIPARFGVELVVDVGVIFYVSHTLQENTFKVDEDIWLAFNASSVRFIPG